MSDLDQSWKRTVRYGSDRTQPLSLSADEGRALDVSGAAREICVLQFSADLITIFVLLSFIQVQSSCLSHII